MGKVGGVVPDVDALADAPPCFYAVARTGVLLAASDGVGRARCGAVAHYHVGARHGDAWWSYGVLVSEQIDCRVGEFVLNGVGHGIDEAEHGSHRRTFGIVDGLALGASAVAVDDKAVVLRHRHY